MATTEASAAVMKVHLRSLYRGLFLSPESLPAFASHGSFAALPPRLARVSSLPPRDGLCARVPPVVPASCALWGQLRVCTLPRV
jgi:hypothetical protein